ncbi:MAG: choice-of-anchor D domain-containing protein, partial [Gammaproteobacteria bacterium]|nr:choice-of-anchor D domain-containing protein [Gammaproteobacteria bacterium]
GTTTVSGGNNSLAGATVLDIGDTLVISGGSLDLGALSPSFTTYTQSGGTLNGTGTVTVSGASTMGSVVGATTTMTGAGTTRFDGAFAIIGSGVHDFTGGRTLLTTGTTTWTNAAGNDGQIRFGGNARIENQGTWMDNTSVNTTINPNLGGGSFTNTVSGVYQKNTATTVTISSQFNNDGLVDILAGSLTLTGGGTHNGDFVFAPGAQLNLSGGTHNFLATSSLTGDAFTFSGGTVNMGGTYDISGSTTVTGGNNSLVGATVLDIGDTLVISGGSLDLGALAPSITTYTQSGGTLNGTGTVTVSGASTMGSVVGATTTMTGAGTTRFDGAFAIIGSGVHDFTAGRTLLTTGTTTWTNAAGNDGQIRFGGNARIENQGTWLDNTSVNTSINPNLGGGSFTNTVSGVYQKNTTTTTSISSQFSNDGLLDLQAGTMALSGGGTLNGDLDIATGATLQLSGSTFALNSVDVALDGRLLISGGTVNQSGTLTTVGDGLLELSGGTLNVGGSVSVGTYTQSGGTLGGAGNLTVRGAATLGSAAGSSTTMLGAGTTSFEASLALIGSGVHDFSGGRTALLLGDTTWTNAAGNNGQLRLGFNSRIENHGLWLDNTSISTTINPSLGGGVFVIAANGTYRKATTTTTTVSAALDNLGAVDVQDGTFTATGNVAQQVGNTLAGGAWRVSGNGVLNLDEAGAVNFTTNQGDVTLDGASASFARINTLTTNQGAFRLLGARNFTAVGAFANSGVLQLGGGTFNAPGLSNSAAGEIFGFGTITPVVINSGIVRASGGTLTASNGIDGQSGTLQSDAGATLALGANSDGDFLVNNGTLALGTANVTVAQDYTNGNFGVGNSFDARANVTGTGQILASGDVAQALTGAVSNGGTANASMAFGNIHVGDVVTQQYSIANSGSNGPALRGAIQTNVNGGNLTDGRLSGSGVTAGNFGPIAAAGAAVQDVTFTGSTAGALSGQSVAVVNNFDNVAEQVLSVSGAVFRYANPSVHTPEPVNFGNRRVGDVTNQVLSLTNDVPNDGFSERLDASIGGVTGTATSNGGSFSLLNAGATDSSSLAVGIDTASAGHKTGTATITLTSNGAGTSDLGSTALGAQTVNVSGDVFRLATASAHTPEPVVFANRHVGDGASQALSLTNTAANDGFSERLNASIGGVT